MTRTRRAGLAASALLLSLADVSGQQSAALPSAVCLGQDHFTTLGSNRIHYVTAGKGETAVVFVHCWAGNCTLWRDQVSALADSARLILVDLPGHGRSDKPHTAYTMDYFAQAVLAVMSDARVDRAVLVGHSMGVPVICRTCKQEPERVAALVAVDGFLRRPELSPEQTAQWITPFQTADYRAHTTNFINELFPAPRNNDALRNELLAEILETPQYVMSGAMEGMFDAGQPDWDLKRVNVPVLVINSTNPLWTDDYKNHVRSLSPTTEYRTIDGTGHWLMLEKPAEFNALLIDLLRRHGLIGK
jgi:pimeloyl-ACP methyl ester carboxylesterase